MSVISLLTHTALPCLTLEPSGSAQPHRPRCFRGAELRRTSEQQSSQTHAELPKWHDGSLCPLMDPFCAQS